MKIETKQPQDYLLDHYVYDDKDGRFVGLISEYPKDQLFYTCYIPPKSVPIQVGMFRRFEPALACLEDLNAAFTQ